MRIEQADRSSELWKRLRANIGPSGGVDPDEHADAIWLALHSFKQAADMNTTGGVRSDLGVSANPASKETD